MNAVFTAYTWTRKRSPPLINRTPNTPKNLFSFTFSTHHNVQHTAKNRSAAKYCSNGNGSQSRSLPVTILSPVFPSHDSSAGNISLLPSREKTGPCGDPTPPNRHLIQSSDELRPNNTPNTLSAYRSVWHKSRRLRCEYYNWSHPISERTVREFSVDIEVVVLGNSVKTHKPWAISARNQTLGGTFDSSFSDTQPKTDVFKPLFASYSIMKPLQGKSRCIREQR